MSQVKFQTGQDVRFRLGDLICPDLEQVLAEIGPDVDVSGRIIFLSDRGKEKGRFAILGVNGIASPVIVPVEHLHSQEELLVDENAAV